MSDCPHELWERESDVTADGSCPICLRAEIEQLSERLQRSVIKGRELLADNDKLRTLVQELSATRDTAVNMKLERDAEVERLRAGWKREADEDCKWALAEIERLRAESQKWMELAGQGLQDEHGIRVKLVEAAAEIERLRIERDNFQMGLVTATANIVRLREAMQDAVARYEKEGDAAYVMVPIRRALILRGRA
jgi:chromosome segregation ATPase